MQVWRPCLPVWQSNHLSPFLTVSHLQTFPAVIMEKQEKVLYFVVEGFIGLVLRKIRICFAWVIHAVFGWFEPGAILQTASMDKHCCNLEMIEPIWLIGSKTKTVAADVLKPWSYQWAVGWNSPPLDYLSIFLYALLRIGNLDQTMAMALQGLPHRRQMR